MSESRISWNHQLRTIMFSRLVMEFGPYSTWGKADYPDGKKERYEEVLRELASHFTAVSEVNVEWTAVRQQVHWGFTKQESVLDAARARSYILNKAAAIETGFIKRSDLPAQLRPLNT